MEGFSTPWSNKRTASLPNSPAVGLQSRCSVLSGSPSLGLRLATAPHQTHTKLGFPPLGHAARPITTGIPAPWPHQKTGGSRSHSLPGYPPTGAHWSSGNAELQLCVGWLDPSVSLPIRACQATPPCGKTGASPTGTGTSLAWVTRIHHAARIPAPGADWAPALQAFQIAAPPSPAQAANGGLQACLRDAQRLDWTLKD
jgi:hypothetical protein